MIKRLLFFAYGAAAYLIFLATLLWAIAFVGGFAVTGQLDGHSRSSLLEALLVDGALLTIFAVQHSVMARRWFKNLRNAQEIGKAVQICPQWPPRRGHSSLHHKTGRAEALEQKDRVQGPNRLSAGICSSLCSRRTIAIVSGRRPASTS